MAQLREAFPEAFFNHCFAIKANPIRGVLKVALDTGYMGAECASIGEVIHAHQCGFPPSKIVYDSPVKSKVLYLQVRLVVSSEINSSRFLSKTQANIKTLKNFGKVCYPGKNLEIN